MLRAASCLVISLPDGGHRRAAGWVRFGQALCSAVLDGVAQDGHPLDLHFEEGAKTVTTSALIEPARAESVPRGHSIQRAQNMFTRALRNASSSAVEARLSASLRCGKRPNRSITLMCAVA
jgi:hypothetical protein